ncbi:hypothetical protein SS50377_25588 [Spironucleus salmonicida]|uniref:Uncharacterized protein n=1 Tax=Spironucleus salmonicida TaxID=348837 RepID=V6LKG4_9EUKA|nr:hypothetical protein SS50377_25588 [Spironucleus salmonicida]|eukprot:EST45135.1 Hypothetical protein SS50377_15157 [Spironucleus salmonicida]
MIVNNKLMVDQQQLQLTNESLRSLVFKIYNSKLSYHEFLITEGRIQPQQILQIPMIVNSSISMISQHQSFQDGQTLVWCFDDTENTVLQVLRLKQRDLKKIVFQLSKEINKPKQSQLQEIQLQQISNLVNNSSSIIDINLQPIQPQQLVNNFNIFSEDTKNDIMSYSGIFDQVELKNESIPIHQLQNKSELQQNINNVTQNFAPLSFLPPRPNSFVNLIEQHTPTQLRLEEQNIQRNQHLDDLNSDENQNKKHQQESNFLKMSDSGDGQNIKNEESEIIGLQQKIQDVELVTANLILQAEYVQEMDLTLDKMAQQINRLTKQIVGNKRMIVHGRFEQYLTCCVLISVVLILKFSYRLDE